MLGDAYYQHTKCVGKNLSVIPYVNLIFVDPLKTPINKQNR